MMPIPFSLANQFGRAAGAITIQYTQQIYKLAVYFLNDKPHQRNFIRRRGRERKSLKETSTPRNKGAKRQGVPERRAISTII